MLEGLPVVWWSTKLYPNNEPSANPLISRKIGCLVSMFWQSIRELLEINTKTMLPRRCTTSCIIIIAIYRLSIPCSTVFGVTSYSSVLSFLCMKDTCKTNAFQDVLALYSSGCMIVIIMSSFPIVIQLRSHPCQVVAHPFPGSLADSLFSYTYPSCISRVYYITSPEIFFPWKVWIRFYSFTFACLPIVYICIIFIKLPVQLCTAVPILSGIPMHLYSILL